MKPSATSFLSLLGEASHSVSSTMLGQKHFKETIAEEDMSVKEGKKFSSPEVLCVRDKVLLRRAVVVDPFGKTKISHVDNLQPRLNN